MKKQCSRCGLTKHDGDFYQNRDSPDELRSICKACDKEKRSGDNGDNGDVTRGESGKSSFPLVDMGSGVPTDVVVAVGEMCTLVVKEIHEVTRIEFGPCPSCRRHDMLFEIVIKHSFGVKDTAVCNSCILNSDTGAIQYRKDGDKFYAVIPMNLE